MRVWSVGHSTHSFDGFVALLHRHAITLVADVRSVPKSRRHPHFHIDALRDSLPAAGIAYTQLTGLGGWRRAAPESPNTGWRNNSFRGYADYAISADFAMALEALRELAASRPTVMMCSEALWWRCHRRLIADRLVLAGDTVCHIGADGRTAEHSLTPFAVTRGDGRLIYPAE
jgi:uncharacterized protein (DUF488 family)